MAHHKSLAREQRAAFSLSFTCLLLWLFSSSCGGGAGSGGSTSPPVPQISLRSTSVIVGPAAGTTGAAIVTSESGSAVSWTASTGTSWIHLTDTSGATASLGSLARFTYDANTASTRQGTITYASSAYSGTLTVTQAGVGYAATLPTPTPILTASYVSSFAVDLAGNVYFLPTFASGTTASLQEWSASTGSEKAIDFPGTGQCVPPVLANALYVNEAEILVADFPQECPYNGTVVDVLLQWTPGNTQSILLDYAYLASGLTPDWQGHYFAAVSVNGSPSPTTNIYRDGPNGFALQPLATLPQYQLSGFTGDTNGNLFVIGSTVTDGDPTGTSIMKVNSQTAVSSVVADLGSAYTNGLALDGSGNLYSLVYDPTVQSLTLLYYLAQWSPSTGQLIRLSPTGAFRQIYGDGVGNIYAETPAGDIEEFTPVFVNTTPVVEGMAAGSDQLPAVIPATTTFTALSDSPWLTITGQSEGIVSFSFTATSTARTAHITVLGQTISVSQQP